MARVELKLPDLGFEPGEVFVSLWLVEAGQPVAVGDRMLEVICGAATVDLPAPASGLLVEQCVCDDEPIAVEQVLGVIEASRELKLPQG